MADPVSWAIGLLRLALQSVESLRKWRAGRALKPRWFEGTSPAYRELLTKLEADYYEVKEPTPGGAQDLFDRGEGWKQCTTPEGRPVTMGGTPEAPHHMPICRRVATHGLSDEAKKLVVAAYRNPYRHHSFQYIPAGYKSEPHLVADGQQGLELRGSTARRVLNELERADLVREERGQYIYYSLTPRAAEAAEWMIQHRRVPA